MIDNIIFGKEIKALNILNNPDYEYPVFNPIDWDGKGASTEEIRKYVKICMATYSENLKTKIKYITNPIYEAWQNNENKLIEMMPHREHRNPQYGVFIYKLDKLLMVNYFYCDAKNNHFFYLSFVNDILMFANFVGTELNGQKGVWTFNPYRNTEVYKEQLKSDRPPNDMDAIDINLELDWLINHMTIEPKFLGPRSKLHEQNCKYENHTNHSIEIIKSNYLYDLHKSGAFKVAGHFRWQPYKDGEKKLIFISDFVKSGYTTKLRSSHNN